MATTARRWVLLVVGLGALALPASAYINGGDFRSTLRNYEQKQKANGWGVSFGASLPPDSDRTKTVADGVSVADADGAEFERYVNRLVGQALQGLPEEQTRGLTMEAKREVARQAREAIRMAALDRKETTKAGQTGQLRYEVGVQSYETYWETNYGGKREIHARKTGLAPFVSLKFVPEK